LVTIVERSNSLTDLAARIKAEGGRRNRNSLHEADMASSGRIEINRQIVG
jgi:hypothetical protein